MFRVDKLNGFAAALFLALATLVSNAPAQQPSVSSPTDEADVIRVDTNLVNTLFTAIDKDRHFVTSLGASDVRIFENNVAQTISVFERQTDRPLTLASLLIQANRSEAYSPMRRAPRANLSIL